MKTLERHSLNRYDSIARVLTENRAVVAHIRELSFSTSKFCKIVEVIRKRQKEFNSQLHSEQLRTLRLKDELIMILLAAASALYQLGKESENALLLGASKFSQKELFAMDEKILLEKSMTIYQLASRYCRELKEYDLTKSRLQFLKNKTEEFKAVLNADREKYFYLNHSIISLDELFMQADKILKNIDGFVKMLGSSYADFSRDYTNIRYAKTN
ncbi:MAG TPA: hypothetical protein VHO03_00600 [Ignavibacteriales bacterium]|nr:hypothetical protein [Ignavibacteriales bacterium]